MSTGLYSHPPSFYFVFGAGEWGCVRDVRGHKSDDWVLVDEDDTTWPTVARDMMRVGCDIVAVVVDPVSVDDCKTGVIMYVDSLYVVKNNEVKMVAHRGPMALSHPTVILQCDDREAEPVLAVEFMSMT